MTQKKRCIGLTRDQALQFLRAQKCPENVVEHCICVSEEAVRIAQECQKRGDFVDVDLVEIGALLHDVGRSVSHGMDHAVIGARLASDAGFDIFVVNIIKKHIGGGIGPDEIKLYNLPVDDYIPETLEEKIVAHADNLYQGLDKITIFERIDILKKRGVSKEALNRIICLAQEIEPDLFI